VFSGSRGPSEADLNLYFFKKITDQEKEKVAEYFQEKTQLQKHEEKLRARLKRLNKTTQELAVKESEFRAQQSERKITLSKIRLQKSAVLQRLKNLRSQGLVQKLEDTGLLDGLTKASFLEERGRLRAPAKGVQIGSFGIVKMRESTYHKNNKGIFIQTPIAQEVQSVFEGKITYVGSIGGFGRTLIVDHGDHYYTVYSSLSDVNVKEGQWVAKSASLGKAGPSSFYKNSGIYFEVRHFSEPQNPAEWLEKGSL
jgi:septal ring factor EnvC (AmiA/AmiB activator)